MLDLVANTVGLETSMPSTWVLSQIKVHELNGRKDLNKQVGRSGCGGGFGMNPESWYAKCRSVALKWKVPVNEALLPG